MKCRLLHKLSLVVSLVGIVSCAQKSSNPETLGKTSKLDNFQLKAYEEQKWDNGLQVLLIPDQTLPRVSLGVLVKVGSAQDPVDKLGLASFTGEMLENGTQSRSATKFADEIGQIASELSISAGSEGTLLFASSIKSEREKLLELFSDALLHPAFDVREIQRLKIQVLSEIERRQDNPSSFADLLLAKVIFGEHPYSHASNGEIQTVKALAKADLKAFYQKYYTPENSILYVAGAFDNKFVEQVKKTFLKWQGKAPEPWQGNRAVNTIAPGIKLFTKPELKQAQIRMAQRGISRTDPDYLALRLANIALGGEFVSRLNFRVRDQLGLTYSIHSSLDARKDPGSFEISTFSRNEKVAETISETRKVLAQFVETGITEEELQAAKALLIGQFPAALETTDKLAGNLLMLRLQGIDDDYIKKFTTNLNEINLEQVNRAIKNHYRPGDFRVVVYADKAQVLEQIKQLGPVETEEITAVKK